MGKVFNDFFNYARSTDAYSLFTDDEVDRFYMTIKNASNHISGDAYQRYETLRFIANAFVSGMGGMEELNKRKDSRCE